MKEETIVHIGLHKTGTKYLQHHLFPKLDVEGFNYNPEPFTQYAMDYIKAEASDRPLVLKAIIREREELKKDNRKKLISKEIMCGDLFSAYRNWKENVKGLKDVFGECKIIVSLRFQPNWLISCYRESVHEHHYQPIEKFLAYDSESDEFLRDVSPRNNLGFAQLDALRLDYEKMLSELYQTFDRENVFVYFFEDFKRDRTAVIERILDFIGSGAVEPKPISGIPNRGYSAASIERSIERYKELRHSDKAGMIHRPIFFHGKNSIPAGNIELSVLDKDKYWGPQFLRDNEEVRSPNYPNLSDKERTDLENSWRYQVKNVFDKEKYTDWDLLGDLREPLEDYYTDLNAKLKNVIDGSVPEIYFHGTRTSK
ncbi:hypothetical protein HZ996_04810 [Cryomorphaceae bacterium]|nr:hypothetical protein HZ996_04810 [Cryomorphaceae bacterium]